MDSLAGKLAILSHASSDMGRAVASALAQQGMQLALVDANSAAVESLAAKLKSDISDVVGYHSEDTESGVTNCLETIIDRQGTPHFLITCPSRTVNASIIDLSETDFRRALELNLVHAFLWSKIVGATMLRAGTGAIVHITGLSGMGGWQGWLAQSVAYGGVHNLVHTLAVEWAKSGVRVNALVPGITPAIATEIGGTSPHLQEEIRGRIPMNRLATHPDVCNALLYLISPTSSYVSGEILRVDGGWDIWGQLHAVAKE